MVLPEAGYYQFSYEIIDGQGNNVFPDVLGGVLDVTNLPPVGITLDNIPDILER